MHGSSFLPWLLVGPILVATLGHGLHLLTGWGPLDYVWKGALLIALGVIGLAFGFGFYDRVQRDRRAGASAAQENRPDDPR